MHKQILPTWRPPKSKTVAKESSLQHYRRWPPFLHDSSVTISVVPRAKCLAVHLHHLCFRSSEMPQWQLYAKSAPSLSRKYFLQCGKILATSVWRCTSIELAIAKRRLTDVSWYSARNRTHDLVFSSGEAQSSQYVASTLRRNISKPVHIIRFLKICLHFSERKEVCC